MTTFVLVGGFWIGAWAWRDVAARLKLAGHRAFPLSLAGLGERKAEAAPSIGLETHVADVVHFLVAGDLHDVVLVGHSGAGAIVNIVAARVPDRVASLVFVDSGPVPEGQCIADFSGPTGRADAIAAAVGGRLPLPAWSELGEAMLAGPRRRQPLVLPSPGGAAAAKGCDRPGAFARCASRQPAAARDPVHDPARRRAPDDQRRQSVVRPDGWPGVDAGVAADRSLAHVVRAGEARRHDRAAPCGVVDRHSQGAGLGRAAEAARSGRVIN